MPATRDCNLHDELVQQHCHVLIVVIASNHMLKYGHGRARLQQTGVSSHLHPALSADEPTDV